MKLVSSQLLMATGILHTAVGAIELEQEVAALWHNGVIAFIDPNTNPSHRALLWFFVSGFLMMALAASYRTLEAYDRLPRSCAAWLALLGLSITVPLPASGGWLLFPQAALVFARARRSVPRSVTNTLGDLLECADVVDVKTITSVVAVRSFAAAVLSYQPGWISALYIVRAGLVRLLGMTQDSLPGKPQFSAQTLPCAPGAKVGFFQVHRADDSSWSCQADERHLCAALGVVEDTSTPVRRLHVVTIVHYKHWTGPLYFNLIRPFHHLIVRAMLRAGQRA